MQGEEFKQDVERDAIILHAALIGGYKAVCFFGMMLPDFKDGPDAINRHAEWIKNQPEEYRKQVAEKASAQFLQKRSPDPLPAIGLDDVPF